MSSVYVLDANVFIAAARQYYAFDLAPGFWSIITQHAEHGRIRSIDRVLKEIQGGYGELLVWAENDFRHAFVSTDDDEVIAHYRTIMNWVNNQQFAVARKAEFASGADGWLIAYALSRQCMVVSLESRRSQGKIKIPNVCDAFKIPCIDTFEMMRSLGVRLTA